MNTFLLTLGTLFVLVLSALFAVPHFVEWSAYRTTIEQKASEALGRPVRVGADLSVRFLPVPYIKLTNVRIADDQGRFARPVVRVRELTAELSIPQLIQGRLEAARMRLQAPQFNLAVDEGGRASWAGLGLDGMAGPFDAAEVSLREVEIERGEVLLITADGADLNRFSNINGIFSAGTLFGPYRFQGDVGPPSSATNVRISTARLGSDGRLTLKTTLRPAGQSADWGNAVIEGDIISEDERWRFEGGLTARLTRALGAVTAMEAPQIEDSLGRAAQTLTAVPVEIKSTIEADTQSITMAAIAMNFEVLGRPQIVKGSARTSWRNGLTFDSDFSARWLDLDGLAGTDKPGVALGVLAQDFNAIIPEIEDARFAFSLQQANLLGGTVEDINIRARRRGDSLLIKELRAGLPGSGRLELVGRLETAGSTLPQFRGVATARGVNLARTLAWIAPGTVGQAGRVASYYSVEADVELSPRLLDVTNMVGELSGNPFQAAYRASLGPQDGDGTGASGSANADASAASVQQWQRRLLVNSERLDLRGLAAPDLRVGNWLAELLGGGGAAAAAPTSVAPGSAAGMSPVALLLRQRAQIDARIGRLLLPQRVLTDVEARFSRRGSALLLEKLKFVEEGAARFEIEGRLQPQDDVASAWERAGETSAASSDAPGGREKGSAGTERFGASLLQTAGVLRFQTEIETTEAFADWFTQFFRLPREVLGDALYGRLAAITSPSRLAGRVLLGRRGPGSLDMQLDGTAQESRLLFALNLLQGDAAAGGKPNDPAPSDAAASSGPRIDASLNLTHPDGHRLLEQIAGRPLRYVDGRPAGAGDAGDFADQQQEPLGPGRLNLRVTGDVNGKLAAFASLEGDELSAAFSGSAMLDGTDVSVDGDVSLQSGDATIVSHVFDVDALALADDAGINLTARLAANPARAEVSLASIRLGQVQMEATGTVTIDDEGYGVDATLTSPRIDVADAMALILQPTKRAQVGPADDDRERADAFQDERAAAQTVLTRTQAILGRGTLQGDGAALGSGSGADAAAAKAASARWFSERLFRFDRFERTKGRLRFEVADLSMGDRIAVAKSQGALLFSQDGLTLQSFDGEALGGRVSAAGSLKRETAGAALSMILTLDAGDLSALGFGPSVMDATEGDGRSATTPVTASEPARGAAALTADGSAPLPVSREAAEALRLARAEGTSSEAVPVVPAEDELSGGLRAQIEVSGRGLSPLGIASVAKGGGSLGFGPATIPGIDPAIIMPTARSWIGQPGEADADDIDALRRQLARALRDTYVKVPDAKRLQLQIEDGRLRAEPVSVPLVSGTTDATTPPARLAITGDATRMTGALRWTLTPAPLRPASALGGEERASDVTRGEDGRSLRRIGRDGAPREAPTSVVVVRAPPRALPSVVVTLAGGLSSKAATVSYGLETTALERELMVRRMEANVERLEELRAATERAAAAARAADEARRAPERVAPVPIEVPVDETLSAPASGANASQDDGLRPSEIVDDADVDPRGAGSQGADDADADAAARGTPGAVTGANAADADPAAVRRQRARQRGQQRRENRQRAPASQPRYIEPGRARDAFGTQGALDGPARTNGGQAVGRTARAPDASGATASDGPDFNAVAPPAIAPVGIAPVAVAPLPQPIEVDGGAAGRQRSTTPQRPGIVVRRLPTLSEIDVEPTPPAGQQTASTSAAAAASLERATPPLAPLAPQAPLAGPVAPLAPWRVEEQAGVVPRAAVPFGPPAPGRTNANIVAEAAPLDGLSGGEPDTLDGPADAPLPLPPRNTQKAPDEPETSVIRSPLRLFIDDVFAPR